MSLYFDRKKFFAGYRKAFGSLSQSQTDGITFILDSAEKDRLLDKTEDLGYMLGTTKHESAHTMKPIHEYGGRAYFIRRYGSQTKVGRELGNDTPEEGAIYSGEGDVQLTGETNFEKAENALRKFYPEVVADFEKRTGRKFDLTVGDQPGDDKDPANAGDPAIAYAIMSFGMHTGMFTGKKLSDYNLSTLTGRRNARRVINGDVKENGDRVGNYAVKFMAILNEAQVSVPQAIQVSAAASQEEKKVDTSETPNPIDKPLADQPPTASDKVETPASAMPDPAAPPKATQQTSDVQVSDDGTTAVTANTKVGGFRWFIGAVIAIVTGQATVPEFVSNGVQSTSFWTVVLNIFANLWAFKVYIIGAILVIFIVRKIEATVLKVAAMRINSDPTRGNAVLTQPTPARWFTGIRAKLGV